MITHKINMILHDSDELSHNYHIRKTNEKIDGLNAGKYKIITQMTIKHDTKEQLSSVSKIID